MALYKKDMSENYQTFAGSRPWYIMASMRQEGFRTVMVLSYLRDRATQKDVAVKGL